MYTTTMSLGQTNRSKFIEYKRTECGPSQFGSSRERIAAANAANVQYAGQQRVIIIKMAPYIIFKSNLYYFKILIQF